MQQDVENQFDQIVPGMADKDKAFLGEIQRQARAQGLSFDLQAQQRSRRDQAVVLRGTMSFGNQFRGAIEYTLTVYADRVGQALQTGWQLTSPDIGSAIGMRGNMGAMAVASQARISNNPNTQRQMMGQMQLFQNAVFLPIVQMLMEASQQAMRPATNGFLGA